MTRKAPTKKAKPAKTAKAKVKPAKKPAKKAPKAKKVTAFAVQRQLPAENTSYSDPDRLFATKSAAAAHAAALNRELRAYINPFESNSPQYAMTGGEKAFFALLKKLKLTAPKKPPGEYSYIDWEQWWDRSYFNMTDAQRDAIWDVLDKFYWYEVKSTTLE
jgi:hypothetical protein